MKTRVLTTLGLFGTLALASAQTIPNPSFEANSFTTSPGYYSQTGNGAIVGWVASGLAGLNPASGNPFADNGTVPDGANVAFIQRGTNSYLSTVISNLTVGETYKVNFRVNARAAGGATPNLKVDIAGTNIINTTIAPVGGSNPYRYFAFDFTAADTNQTMTLRNDADPDSTVLLDNFSIAVHNSGWSYAAWNDDATSGVSATNTYTHAFHFGTSGNMNINGVTFTGIPGPNPSQGGSNSFYTSGFAAVFNNDSNNLTNGGSAVLAHDFVYGGPPPQTITINGLVAGKSYLATIYSVGFDTNGARAATFSLGTDRLTVNQDQFGDDNGIRVSCAYLARSPSMTLTYVPLSGSTFHTYGFSNYELVGSNYHALFLVVTNLADSGPGTLRQAIANAESGDTITFATNGTITLTSSPLFITTNLNIAGPGPASLAVDGNLAYRVFELGLGLTSRISGLTIQNGRYPNGGGLGNLGTMVLSNCVITGNAATASSGFGGAIHNGTSGVLTLIACTVRYNYAGSGGSGTTGGNGSQSGGNPNGGPGSAGGSGGNGGGIYNQGMLTLTACTVNNNSAGNGGDGGNGGQGYYDFWAFFHVGFTHGSGGDAGNGGPGGKGGGIFNVAGATLSLTNCTIYRNGAGIGGEGGNGGGVSGESFFYGGSAGSGGHGGGGGGIYSEGTLDLTACTVCDNHTGDGGTGDGGEPELFGLGGGVVNATSGEARLRSTLVARNSDSDLYPSDLYGTYFSDSHNLVGYRDSYYGWFSLTNQTGTDIVPGLGQRIYALLAPPDNTGQALTVGLLAGSPAVDAGDDTLTNTLATDERGAPRRYGAHVDVGAFEAELANVTSLNDSGAGSLRDALATNSVVGFAPNLDGRTVTLTGGQIALAHSVTVDASSLPHGVTISGNHSNRIFEVTTGAVVNLDSLTLMNGYAGSGGSGGAILVDSGATLTLTNSTLSSNSAANGGGLANNGTVTVSASTLSANSATNNGGAIDSAAGAWLGLYSSTLSGNSAASGGGLANNGTVTVSASTLSANFATNNGAAIDSGAGSRLTLYNSTLSGNSAGAMGGGLEADQATVTAINCTLSDNFAPSAAGINNYGTLVLTNTIVAGNNALANPNIYTDSSGSFAGVNNLTNGNPGLASLGNYGGPTLTMPPVPGSPAIDAGSDSAASFLRTDQRGFLRFVGRHVDIGAVEYTSSGITSVGVEGYTSITIVTNTADSGAGSLRDAITFAGSGATITFAPALSGLSTILTSGQLTIHGPLSIDASALPSGFTIFGNNSNRIFEVATGAVVNLDSLTLMNGYAGSGGSGGAILVDSGGTLTLTNCTVSGNSATGIGGAIGNYGVVNINESTVSSNSASGAGAIENDNGTLTINASTLSSNSTTGNGGAIDNDAGAVLLLNNSTLSGNSAGSGGGIENYQATATLINCTLSANSASVAGGINNQGTLALTNTIVAGNTAPAATNINSSTSFAEANNLTDGIPLLAPLGNYGGPTQTMPPLPGSPALDAGNDTAASGLATDQRGFPRRIGAQVDIGAVEYLASPVVANTADSGAGSLRDAVAFATNGATITLAPALSGLTSTLTNGQLTIYASLSIDASALPGGFTISGNNSNRIFEIVTHAVVTLNSLSLMNGYAGADSGGAILVDSGGTLTLNNSTLSSNSAGGIGGAIGNFGGAVSIDRCTFSGNAAAFAGAIENLSDTLTINASTFSGNFATNNGGAIDNDYGAALQLNNCTFSGNFAGGGGGGLENYQATATINNSTFSGNSAGGAAGINNYGTLALTNTIVAGNSAPILPDINLDVSGSFAGANNLTNGNPLIAPLGNYGGPTQTMPPLHGSPAIDAAQDSVTNFLATDQRGFPRLSGAHVDIGAVEAQWASPASPPLLTSPVPGSAGAFSFSFTNLPHADFTVLTSTNVALAVAQWSILGTPVHNAPGQYQFTDSSSTNYPWRFYQLVSP